MAPEAVPWHTTLHTLIQVYATGIHVHRVEKHGRVEVQAARHKPLEQLSRPSPLLIPACVPPAV